MLGARIVTGGFILSGHRQKDANGCTVILPVLAAFNLNAAPVAFHKLLRNQH